MIFMSRVCFCLSPRAFREFASSASGLDIVVGRDEGVTKLLFDDSPEAHGHGKILGGGMVGTHAGDMIGEVALAIEMGADAVDIGKTIHPHPTLGESIGMAAEVAHGSCTDLPPAKKSSALARREATDSTEPVAFFLAGSWIGVKAHPLTPCFSQALGVLPLTK